MSYVPLPPPTTGAIRPSIPSRTAIPPLAGPKTKVRSNITVAKSTDILLRVLLIVTSL
jgi:hypothetical protein